MRLLKCPKCGEMFSDTYKTCPFCQEDEELHSDKPVKHSHRRTGGGRAKPKVGGVAVVVCLVLVLGLAAYTIFGSQLKDIFGGKKNVEPQPDTQTLTLSQSSVELAVGNSVVLSATGADKATFSSSDEGVATVTVDGTVKAVGAGSAVITVKAAEQAATCRVTVTAPASEDPVKPEEPDVPDTPDTPVQKTLTLQSIYGKRSPGSRRNGLRCQLELFEYPGGVCGCLGYGNGCFLRESHHYRHRGWPDPYHRSPCVVKKHRRPAFSAGRFCGGRSNLEQTRAAG